MILTVKKLADIQKEVNATALACGRDPKAITIMPVTKMVDSERILQVLKAGYTLIGENRVQEIQAKAAALALTAHETHLIGHLQTNKVKDVIGLVNCIESLDSLKLARKLQDRLETVDRQINVYIEVNTSGEKAKSGIPLDMAIPLIEAVIPMDRLHIKGLMTIAAHSEVEAEVRACFKSLVQLQSEARDLFSDKASFDVLSMGMSSDWKWAIEEGSTLLRIGSAIFGARDYH